MALIGEWIATHQAISAIDNRECNSSTDSCHELTKGTKKAKQTRPCEVPINWCINWFQTHFGPVLCAADCLPHIVWRRCTVAFGIVGGGLDNSSHRRDQNGDSASLASNDQRHPMRGYRNPRNHERKMLFASMSHYGPLLNVAKGFNTAAELQIDYGSIWL